MADKVNTSPDAPPQPLVCAERQSPGSHFQQGAGPAFPPPRHRGYDAGMSDQQKRNRLVGVVVLNFSLIVWYLVGGGPVALITTVFLAALAIGGWIVLRRTA
jgi:hypothetical protein